MHKGKERSRIGQREKLGCDTFRTEAGSSEARIGFQGTLLDHNAGYSWEVHVTSS